VNPRAIDIANFKELFSVWQDSNWEVFKYISVNPNTLSYEYVLKQNHDASLMISSPE